MYELAEELAATHALIERVVHDARLDREFKDELRKTLTDRAQQLTARGYDLEQAAKRAAAPPPPPPRSPEPTPVEVDAQGEGEGEVSAGEERPEEPTIPAAPQRRHRRVAEIGAGRAGPSIWSRLGPAFGENLLFALATFLIVGGALFFVTTAWTTMTGTQRLLVVFGGVELFGALLYGAARLLNRGGTLPEVERIVLRVVAFLVPLAAVAAGEVLAIDRVAGLAVALTALGTGWLALRGAARSEHPALHPVLTHQGLALVSLALLAPHAGGLLELAALVAAALLWLGATLLRRQCLPALEKLTPLILGTSVLAFAALAFTADAALAASRANPDASLPELLAPLSFLVAAAALYLSSTGVALGKGDPGARHTGVLLAAFGLAIAALPIASANQRCLLVAAAAATWTAGVLAFRLEKAALLWPALALSAVAYFLLPAPVRQLAMAIRDSFAESLGYAPARLPLSFYGISFLPYVGALAWWAGRLHQRGRPSFSLVVSAWTMAVAGGLSVLSITAGSDARAPMAVLGAQGVLLVVMGWGSRRQRFVFAGLLGLTGSVVSALIWFEVAANDAVTALSVLGVAMIAGAAWLARGTEEEAFHRRASHAVLDAALVIGLGTAAAATFAQLFGLRPEAPGMPLWNAAAPAGRDLVPYAALATLLALLSSVYRRIELGWLATVMLGASALGGLAGAGEGVTSAWAVPAFAAMSWVTLAASALRERLPLPHRPLVAMTPVAPLRPVGMLLLHLAALPALIHAVRTDTYEGPLLLGLALAAGASATAAGVLRVAWPALWSALQLCVAAVLAAGVMGFDPAGTPGAAGLAVASLGLLAGPVLARSTREGLDQFIACLAAPVALVWLLCQRVGDGVFVPVEGSDAIAGLLGAAALVGAAALAPRRGATGELSSLCHGAGGLALGLLALAGLDLAGAQPELLAWAPVAAAAAVGLAGPRSIARAALTLVHLAAGLALAFASPVDDRAGALCQTAAFVLAALVGRGVLGPLPVARTLVVVTGLTAAAWVWLHDALALPETWLLAVVPASLTVATWVQRFRVCGLERNGLSILSGPVLGLLLLIGGVHAGLVIAVNESFLHGGEDRSQEIVTAIAFVLFAVTRAREWGGTRALWLGAASVALATFVVAPLNLLLPAPVGVLPRPDLDVAAIGLALVLVQRRAGIGYAFAAFGLLLTMGELRHVSTPLTCAVAALVPLAIWWRSPRPLHLEIHGYATMVAVWAAAVYLVPETGQPAVEILPLLAALSTALAIVHHLLSGRATTHVLARVSLVGTVAALVMLSANAILRGGEPASPTLCWLAMGAALPAVWVAARRAVVWQRPAELHLAVAAALVGYGFAAERTDWVAFLDGYHLHAVAALGALLLLIGTTSVTRFSTALVLDGLLLPLPAVVAALAEMSARGAAALFLASALYGYAAYRLKHRLLPWVSLSLLNAALFSLWQHHGIVDPAFYGVPAGLSLVIASEVARQHLQPATRLMLWWIGMTSLYGSVAVQVLRVEEPVHALVLFVAGLVAVGWGFVRGNTVYLLVGTGAVVLDVIAYLLRHGLERDFTGAALLVGSGLTVLATAAITARRRRRSQA